MVTLLTEQHGRHAGLVRGGQSPKSRAVYQAGNRVRAQWRARLADHLGSYTCEPLASHAARLFDDADRLTALSAAAAVSERALPEREPARLVHEVHRPITARRGFFAAGKYEQLQRTVPYSALIHAFTQLIRHVLTVPADELQLWREALSQTAPAWATRAEATQAVLQRLVDRA